MREVLYLEMVRLGHGDRTLLSEVSVAPVQSRLYCYHAQTAQSAKTCTVQTHLNGKHMSLMHPSMTHLRSKLYCYYHYTPKCKNLHSSDTFDHMHAMHGKHMILRTTSLLSL